MNFGSQAIFIASSKSKIYSISIRKSPSHNAKVSKTEMQNTAEFYCAFCGEPNLTFVDLSAGGEQSYVEDCQVCCRPNILYVRIDEDTLDIEIDTEYEG